MALKNIDPNASSASEPSLAELVRAGHVDRVMVVGFGITAILLVLRLQAIARAEGRYLQIILVHDGVPGPSYGSGGWFMPFVCPDKRVAVWAHRSFDEWSLLEEAGLGEFRERMGSLIVSRQPVVPVPAGHPGRPMSKDPAEYNLPFYSRGVHLDDGAVISACKLMPKLQRYITEDPSVVVVNRTLHHIGHVIALARSFSADAACIAAGDRARFLLDDRRIDDDFGVLLRGSWEKLPEEFKRLVVMDEDVDAELCYMIPHRKCRHALFGGKSGDAVEELREWEQLQAGLVDLGSAPQFARDAVDEVYQRVLDRMPVLAKALPADPHQPNSYWFGLRPRAAQVITEWFPLDYTGNIPVLHVGGFGGSGFTISPAVVHDALHLALPTGSQAGRGRPKAEDAED